MKNPAFQIDRGQSINKTPRISLLSSSGWDGKRPAPLGTSINSLQGRTRLMEHRVGERPFDTETFFINYT